MLCEAGLDGVAREVFLDVGQSTAAVATVNINSFAEKLFDFRDEWKGLGQRKAVECVVCGFETAEHWTGVKALRSGDVLLAN